jgi:hypothetical protein
MVTTAGRLVVVVVVDGLAAVVGEEGDEAVLFLFVIFSYRFLF